MKVIVVGVDGSEPSIHAVEFAANLAEKFGSRMVAVHSLLPLVVGAEMPSVALGELEAARVRDAEQLLSDTATRLAARNLECDKVLRLGAPAEELADVADQYQADLVVVGNRGRGAVSRVLLGSTSDRLVHIAKRPVLVVR